MFAAGASGYPPKVAHMRKYWKEQCVVYEGEHMYVLKLSKKILMIKAVDHHPIVEMFAHDNWNAEPGSVCNLKVYEKS